VHGGEWRSGSDDEPFRARENRIGEKKGPVDDPHHDTKLRGGEVGEERRRSGGMTTAPSSAAL